MKNLGQISLKWSSGEAVQFIEELGLETSHFFSEDAQPRLLNLFLLLSYQYGCCNWVVRFLDLRFGPLIGTQWNY